MRQFVVFCIAFASLSGAWADDTPPKSTYETLGFDIEKVKPADPDKGQPIARVLYDYIYPAELNAESPKLTDDEARQLTGLIFGTLRQRYIEQHKITATPEEIQQFVMALSGAFATDEIGSEQEKEESRRGREAIGEQAVKGWKFDQALYRKYGGTVIFQQANPFEPVGAYRTFLEKLEQAQVFEVYDQENRTKFWHYFTRKHPFQVPPDKVNFEQPWWMQKK